MLPRNSSADHISDDDDTGRNADSCSQRVIGRK
jgi:hypothetical protein